jgi:hypothetical protein
MALRTWHLDDHFVSAPPKWNSSVPEMPDLVPLSAVKPDKWATFRGLPKWQLALVIIPLTLVSIGGLIGGVIGALGMVANLKLARTTLATGPKALAMAAVMVAPYIAYFVLAVLFLQLT